MKNKLVSIIIPVFNRADIIKITLDSIAAQQYFNWECIVVDDGSTDLTKETVLSYADKDSRFKYVKRPDNLKKGANACRNYGFTIAKGEYINWFDSDDVMFPNFLLEKTDAFNGNTHAVLHRNRYANYSFTRFRVSKFKYGKPLNLFYHFAMEEIEIQTCGLMWKHSFLKDKKLFDDNVDRYQDNEFHIRMLALKPEIKIVNIVLAAIRGGDGDSSQISAKVNLTKKKLYDIFYFRYQTLLLINKVEIHNYKPLLYNISLVSTID
jgi:glycosyltransferase involved in cell wall biosynthesis